MALVAGLLGSLTKDASAVDACKCRAALAGYICWREYVVQLYLLEWACGLVVTKLRIVTTLCASGKCECDRQVWRSCQVVPVGQQMHCSAWSDL